MDIQKEEIDYQKGKTVSLLGNNFDLISLSIFLGGIALSIFIWFYFNLYSVSKYNKYFLIALCLFFIVQIFISGPYSGSYSIEDNEIKEVIQLNAVLFSSIAILLAFNNSRFKAEDSKMLILALILSSFGVVYYSIKKDSDSKRIIRKLKVSFMTIAIFLFINMLFNVGTREFGLMS